MASLTTPRNPFPAFLLLCAVALMTSPHAFAQEKTYVLSYSPGTLFHRLVRDRVKVVYERAGIPVDFVALPHKRSILEANEGDVDGEVGRVTALEKEAPNLIRVNVKLMDLTGAAYVLDNSDLSYSEDLLETRTVGMVRGVQWTQKIMKGKCAEQVNDYQSLFEMLNLKRIDIALATTASAKFELARQPEKYHGIHRLEPAIFTAPIYHYVHKKNAHLIPRLEKALKELKDENYWGDE